MPAHLYWANELKFAISDANLNGTGVNLNLISAGTPTFGVTVDGQRVYWTDGVTSTIGRANLDGSGANPNFITGADGPAAMVIDSHHIYWSNFTDSTIGEANLDGSGVNQNLITGLSSPSGIAPNLVLSRCRPPACPRRGPAARIPRRPTRCWEPRRTTGAS